MARRFGDAAAASDAVLIRRFILGEVTAEDLEAQSEFLSFAMCEDFTKAGKVARELWVAMGPALLRKHKDKPLTDLPANLQTMLWHHGFPDDPKHRRVHISRDGSCSV